MDFDGKNKIQLMLDGYVNDIKDKLCDDIEKRLGKSIASLRAETYTLKQEVMTFQSDINIIKEYIMFEIKGKIEDLQEADKRRRQEKIAAKFLSDDGGFLFMLSDMIALAYRCVDDDSTIPLKKNVEQFIGKYIWPVSNKFIIYNRKEFIDVPRIDASLSLADLFSLYKELKQVDAIETPNLNLMKALTPILEQLVSHEFNELLELSTAQEAGNAIFNITKSIESVVAENGIGIIHEPTDDTLKYFSQPVEKETVRPLIMRLSDNLVYTHGISLQADPLVSIY